MTNVFSALIMKLIKKVLFVILVVIFVCLSCIAKVDVQFTPSNDCEDSIIKYINSPEKTIDIAVF